MQIKKAFVTGAAGFIGSNLVDRLLGKGIQVTGFDNFSTGFHEFIENAKKSPHFKMIKGDVLDTPALTKAMASCDFVFHFAANADVRFGTEKPRKDLEQNTVATFNVLEAMSRCGIKRIAFTSTGSIYGEANIHPTPENAPFPVQTSLYGASKLAGEGLLEAFSEGFGMQVYIFRFVSILGERYTHGHVFDFYKSLLANPHTLRVLGNGKQRKSYLYVQDCVEAVLLAIAKTKQKVNIFNLGTNEYIEVDQSVGWISDYLGVKPKIVHGGGDRGWVGDNPFIFLDTEKIQSLGWKPKLTIKQGILNTLDYFKQNPWLLERR